MKNSISNIKRKIVKTQKNVGIDLVKKITPQPIISFSYHLCEHCNLNCVSCDNFSPLAEEEFTDVNEFTRDMERMAQITSNEARAIMLLGGEPLLNKEICLYIKITRKLFPYANIYISTNGLLICKMSNEFYESCRENNIVIRMTKYPIKFDYDGAEAFLIERGIKVEFSIDKNIVKDMFLEPLRMYGDCDPRDSFLGCWQGNQCTFLKHGKIYPCAVVANIEHFNKKFKQEIHVSTRDYIDIYDDISYDDIANFLAAPTPFCRYCDVKNRTMQPWKVSERNMLEWTRDNNG